MNQMWLFSGPFPNMRYLSEKPPGYWQYPHYGTQDGTPGASVRDGDWKHIRFF